jgi:hypothetical protein
MVGLDILPNAFSMTMAAIALDFVPVDVPILVLG